MNKRLYLLASLVLLSVALSMGTIAYLQGDFEVVGGPTEPSASKVVSIELSEEGIQESSEAVQVEGQSLIITAAGQYEISGQGPEVTVQVAADVADEVTITLNNASFAQLDFQSTGTNILSLAKDSTNSLSGSETGVSATNITLTGEGSLAISEVGTSGIFATDDLVVESGTLSIDSTGSGLYAFHPTEASHGNLTINGGNLTISSSQQAGAALFAGQSPYRLMVGLGWQALWSSGPERAAGFPLKSISARWKPGLLSYGAASVESLLARPFPEKPTQFLPA